MADNFNLRSFLSENILTKNSQLINELDLADVPEAIDLPGVTGQVTVVFYSEHGMGEAEIEVMSVQEALALIRDDVSGAETEDVIINTSDIDQQGDLHPETEGLTCVLEVAIEDHGTYEVYQGTNNSEGGEDLNEGSYSDSYDTPAAKKVGSQLQSAIHDVRSRSDIDPTIDKLIAAAERETQSQVTSSEKRILSSQGYHIYSNNVEMEREGTQNKKPIIKETNLTAKERRLVEMVNNAMGIQEEENVDYTMGRHNDPNQLPNPAPELNIPEGEANIEEAKPLPKYNSIEELMKEIEHGTNEAAHQYKMNEMKRVYEALEAKVGSLEEGEHAEHIDQKAVKQMRKDIAALRKAEEKLRKEFDKKFSGKEKKETPAKEKAVEALQEGTFDLRKFLAENRK